MSDYFADLSPEEKANLAETGARYLPLIPSAPSTTDWCDLNTETMRQVIAWQRLETEVLDAHIDWLGRLKSKCEQAGREWNRHELLRLVDEGDGSS